MLAAAPDRRGHRVHGPDQYPERLLGPGVFVRRRLPAPHPRPPDRRSRVRNFSGIGYGEPGALDAAEVHAEGSAKLSGQERLPIAETSAPSRAFDVRIARGCAESACGILSSMVAI